MEVTLYHNPKCSNSQGAKKILENRGASIQIIEYLDAPLTEKEIHILLNQLPGDTHDLLRTKEKPYKELKLSASTPTPEIAAAIASHPILMQRPVVVCGEKAIIARPPEVLKKWLPKD